MLIGIISTLKEDFNNVGLYTVNIKDFEEFDFLDVQNPLNNDHQSTKNK